MNHLLDSLGWMPCEDPAALHPAAQAAYLHGRTGARLLLFWRFPFETAAAAGPRRWWAFRLPGGRDGGRIEQDDGDGHVAVEDLLRWGDMQLAAAALTDPTPGTSTEEG